MEENLDFEPIADRLRPKPQEADEYPPWIEDNFQLKGEIMSTEPTKEEEGVETEVNFKENKSLKAERFLELIAAGEIPYRAGQQLNVKVGDMMKSKDIKVAVKKLIENGTLPAVVRKAMVRAGLDQIFMEGLESPKGHKNAIQAAKLISQDPDVGLNAPPVGVGVNIDLGSLGNLMKDIKPIEGLEDILDGKAEDDSNL